ncbi:hypothetical protein D3C86_2014750 [compost metagenome]
MLTSFCQRDENAALILAGLLPTHKAIALQTTENTGHAWLENTGLMGKLMALKLSLLTQYPNDPPLLFRQIVLVEGRPKKCHCGFAGLQ